MLPLAGRVGVVTGASSGIGAAIAQVLGAAGMRLALGARRPERLSAVAAAIRAAGGEAEAIPTDMRDEEQVKALIDAAVARYGALDTLVNNAATGSLRTIAEAESEEWRETFATNVIGTLIACRAALRHMLPCGRGDILNVVSVSADGGWPYLGAYAASKAAVRSLSRTLRAEVAAAGIRVLTIDVHNVATEFATNFDPDILSAALGRWRELALLNPASPVLAPDDVARAVLFQLSRPEAQSVHELTLRPRGA
jgi:NADP-dependent 3-hydroxy acid dehydrogenase YdfG